LGQLLAQQGRATFPEISSTASDKEGHPSS